MANEAEIVELLGNGGDPIQVTVADGAGIAKGTLLKITDDRTGAATGADNDPFIGIAAAEKVANDGSTTLAVYTHGVFRLRGSAAIAVGERVSISGANTITKVAAADLLFSNVGVALETIGEAGTIEILVRAG
jgi:hypothetical protein